MTVDNAINWIDRLLVLETGKHLNDLQIFVIGQVWEGRKYIEIATDYHCTEGHIKDIAAALWQLLSRLVGERVTKTNLKAIAQRHNSATISPPPQIVNHQFIGRAAAIASLNESMLRGERAIVIQGEGGIGKTTLAQHFLKTCGCHPILELSMAQETSQITSAEIVVEEWLRQDFSMEPGREFGVTLLRLKRQLSQQKVGILIDNLEPALDRDGRIISSQRSYVELLRILTDRQLTGVTLITSRDRLCEVDLNLAHYRLSGLDLDTWQTYFNYRQIAATATDIQPLHQTYGGNAKAMEIIAGNICMDFDGDPIAYLRSDRDTYTVEAGLKQSIIDRFDRLQEIDPEAYRLLCRLGCYRYQDLARIDIDALLCLLWDIDPDCRSRVVNALKNRSLIEFNCGQFWLHPSIRAESIARLRQCEDWIETNQTAAKYWLDSVETITDTQVAITALEAFYHYTEIGDLNQAARVLLQPRDNQWGQFLPLASNLYRMGLIQPILTAITQIIPDLAADRYTAELYNILGDLYWIIGRVREAIATQKYTIDYTTIALEKDRSTATEVDRVASSVANRQHAHELHCLTILNLDSLLSVGLYHIDLWELIAASELFEKVIELATNTVHARWAQKATVCLALVRSYLQQTDLARGLLAKIEPLIINQNWTGSSAYFLQAIGQTYANLGEFDRAQAIYQQTLTFCQTGNYLQTQGRTLTGLAQVYRQQGNLELAQTTHLEAIEILDRLGAKCDLAEAYYQAGLTWAQAGDFDRADLYRHRHACQLFTEIDAPAQIAKIQ